MLDRIDRVDEVGLLVKRIRVSGVPVLVPRRLEEAHGGQVAVGEALIEVAEVVLVVRLSVVTDLGLIQWREVRGIRSARVVLEWVVMCAVVADRSTTDVCVRRAAHGQPAGGPGWSEAALEPSPGHVLCV